VSVPIGLATDEKIVLHDSLVISVLLKLHCVYSVACEVTKLYIIL